MPAKPTKPPGIRYANHRVWIDGIERPTVTGIIRDGLPMGGLVSAAAKEVANATVNHWSDLLVMEPTDRLDYLKSAHTRAWNEKAARGTRLHAVMEAGIYGEPTEVPPELADTGRILFDWLDAHKVTPLIRERPIANREFGYGGRPDLVADMEWPGRGTVRALLDLKTGENVYDSAAVQLAAYQHAETYLSADETERAFPETEVAGVIHLQPDSVSLYPVDTERAWDVFLACIPVAAWTKACKRAWQKKERWPVGEPA
jgi:hypothetical protein